MSFTFYFFFFYFKFELFQLIFHYYFIEIKRRAQDFYLLVHMFEFQFVRTLCLIACNSKIRCRNVETNGIFRKKIQSSTPCIFVLPLRCLYGLRNIAHVHCMNRFSPAEIPKSCIAFNRLHWCIFYIKMW